MTSLFDYDTIVPQHPAARALLGAYLLLPEGEGAMTPELMLAAFRYRNFYPMEDGTAILLARLGEMRRPDVLVDLLREHPLYLSDEKWDLDETYHSFVFSGMPKSWEYMREQGVLMDRSPTQVFAEALEEMRNG